MPDNTNNENTQNNEETNDTNNQQQNTTTSKEVILGCDSNGNDAECQNTVFGILEAAGYKVTKLSVGPNEFATYSYSSQGKGKIGVYLMADSIFSIGDFAFGGTTMDYGYFGIRGDLGLPRMSTQEDFDNNPLSPDADCRGGVCDKIAHKTYKQINEITKDRCIAVFGTTPEELGKNILSAMGGQYAGNGASGTGTAVAGAVRIPDVTFYGLIKQIIGGIDGVFIIANNLAYLLSFQDLYKYRNEYDEFIPIIEASNVINNSIEKNWTTAGCYNSIELTYADGTIKYQNDTLVKQYGENTFYYDFPDDDEETAKAKADALLAAHIRDYSTDIKLTLLYNENITEGSWIKLPKTLTQISGKTRKEREQEALKKMGKKIATKRKGVNITNMTEELVKQEDNTYKKIQHITDEEGNKLDVEVEDSKYDLFFVQGYSCKWDKNNSLLMDIHLKYGPDTPEDPVNATISIAVEGTNTPATGGTSGTPAWGDDCFSICDICFENCEKVLGYGGGRREDAEKYIREHEADSKYLQGRARQNSTYAKDVSGKTSEEAYTLFRDKFNYACYSDSCDSSYPCCEDLWTKTNAANCGDSTRMLKVLMDATGTPCYGIHVDGHYFNAVQVNGTWHTLDGTRGPENSSCNFPDSGNYSSGSNDCGSGFC